MVLNLYHINMDKKLYGFSLIEILAVMVIMGVLMALGFAAFTSFSRNTTVSEATGNALSILQETQSMAKNNSLPSSVLPQDKVNSVFYYMVEFKHSSGKGVINRYLYKMDVALGQYGLVGNPENNLQSNLNGTIVYHDGETSCVVFEAVSGKLWAAVARATSCQINSVLADGKTSNLEISVGLDDTDLSKVIYIDTANNTFSLQDETN